MKKLFKKICIAITILFCFLVLLLIGSWTYLKTDHAQHLIQGKVNQAIPGALSWEKIELSFLDAGFEIKKLLLKGPSDDKLVSVDRIFLDISWLALLKATVSVQSVIIETPQMWLEQDRDGNLNITKAFPSSKPEVEQPETDKPETPSKGIPFNVALNTFTLSNGLFQFRKVGEDKIEQVSIKAIGLNIENVNLAEKSGQIALSVGKSEVDMAGVKTATEQAYVHGVVNKGQLDTLVVKLDSDTAVLSISGNANNLLSKPLLNFDLGIETSLKKIRETVQIAPELTGTVKVDINARGEVDNPQVGLSFVYGGGSLAGYRVNRIDMQCLLKDRVFTIESLNVKTPMGKIALSADVNLQKAFDRGFLSPPGDLETISYTLALKQSGTSLKNLPTGSGQLEGTVNSTITLKGKGISPENLRAEAAMELKGEKLAVKKVLTPINVHMTAQAALADNMVKLSKLNLSTGNTQLHIDGNYHLDSQEVGTKAVLLIPDTSEILSALGIKDAAGKLALNVALSGDITQPVAKVELTGKGLGFQNITAGNLQLKTSLDNSGTVHLSEFSLKNKGSQIRARGTVKAFDKAMVLNSALPADILVEMNNIEAKNFLNNNDFKGKINGKLTVKGKLMTPEAVFALEGKSLAVGPNRIGDLSTLLKFAQGALMIKELKLLNQRSSLNLAGSVKVLDKKMTPLKDPTFDLKISDSKVFLHDFVDTLNGELRLAASIQGSLSTPSAQFELVGKKLEAGSNRIGDLDAKIRFSEGTVVLKPIKVQNKRSSLKITGSAEVLNTKTLQVLSDPTFDVKIAGDALYLDDFLKNMKGKFALKGHVKGSAARPAGSITLEGKKIDLGVQRIDSIKLSSHFRDERVFIDSLAIAPVKGQRIVIKGWVSPLKKDYELTIGSRGISLKHITALKDSEIKNGKISMDFSGKGSFDDPVLKGNIKVSGLGLRKKRFDDITIDVNLKDHKAHILGQMNFDLEALFNLKTNDFSANLRFDRTDLSPYFKLAGQERLKGVLTGSIKAKGNAKAVDKVFAEVDISQLELFMDKTELIRSREFNVYYQSQKVSITGIDLALLTDGYLTIRGSGKIDSNFDINADGNIPLQVVGTFVKDLRDISGDIKLSSTIGGTLSKPNLNAHIGLNDIGLTVVSIDGILSDINGSIEMNSSFVALNDVGGKFGDGKFDITGKIDLKEFMPTDVNIIVKGQKLPLNVPDTMDIMLDTAIGFRGNPEKYMLTGDVLLLDGIFYKDISMNLLDSIGKKSRQVSPASQGSPTPLLDTIEMNIKIRHLSPFLVDNNMALLALKPDMVIKGKLSNPIVAGRAEIDPGGTVIYQKKEFEVKKGVIDFLNPYKIEPTLDIESETTIRQWTIVLDISGTPDNLIFKMTSDPSEADADILALLLMGRTTREMEGGQFGASQVLADIISSSLEKNVKDSTGLDIVEMKYNVGQEQEGDKVDVTLGKELSRRVTVKYGVEARQGGMIQRATTEYKLLENLLMNAFQDTEGDFGAELIYRLEYR